MLYSRQHNQCDIRAIHDGKVGCNTVEYTTTFLYSDWLYFLWHGINLNIRYTLNTLSASFDQICDPFIFLALRNLSLNSQFPFCFRTVSVIDNMLSMMEKYTNNLETIVNERTRQLQSEKNKTDELLHKMLPR